MNQEGFGHKPLLKKTHKKIFPEEMKHVAV